VGLRRQAVIPGEWLRTTVALLLAVGCGLVLARLLLAPPAGDMRVLAAYLALSGTATVAGGWLAMRAIDRAGGLSIRAQSVFTALTGTAVSLMNVLIVAQLMFVSTAHDLRLLFVLIGFGAAVTVIFSLWVGSTTASRLQAIAESIGALASGDYAERAPVSGADEVSSLARDLNALAAKLQSVEAERAAVDLERRELTAAISHDLRTPLASIRAMVEALDDEVVTEPDEVRRYHVTMRREIDRLSRMIDDLFELAQIDAGAVRLERTPISLHEVVSEVADAMEPQARQRSIDLMAVLDASPAVVAADGSRIERAVANVIRNAIEHTPEGGRVRVELRAAGSGAEVRVTDTGEGIAAAEMAHIWERFYRGSKSRTRAPGGADGAGLGLAITRGIIESHGGSVGASSVHGEGTTITLCLPLDAPPSARS
jgi:signal transduction histidine kinase